MKISSVQHQHQHQHQAMATHLDEFLGCPKPHHQPNQQQDQKKPRPRPRPQPEQAPSCPRCDSSNTKFCYYNNYSLSQPRYFCKGCRRYWTKGGSLRNVPVGGGCRKNHKRSSNSSSSNSNSSTNSSSSSSKKSNDAVHDHLTVVPNPDPLLPALPLPPLSFDPADLTLAFASDSFMLSCPNPSTGTSTATSTSAAGFLDILRGGDNLSYYGFGGIGSNMDQTEGAGASVSTGDAAAAAAATAGAGLMMFPNFDGGLLNSTASASSVCTESVTATTEMDHHSVNVDIEGENSNSNPNKVVMGMGMGLHHHHHHQQWPVVDHGHAAAANLSLDPARDYYWNGVGAAAAPWHGLINSSLM